MSYKPTVDLRKTGYQASDSLNMKADLFYHEGLKLRPEIASVLLTGPAGSGKTYMAEAFANSIGAKFFMFQNTTGVAREDYVLDLNIESILKHEAETSVLPGLLVRALQSTNEGPTVVLIDELDKAREEIDAFMLDFLSYGRVTTGSREFHRGEHPVWVFITSNGQRPFIEPLMNRVKVFKLERPSWELFKKATGSMTERQQHHLKELYTLYPQFSIRQAKRILQDLANLKQEWNADVAQQFIDSFDDSYSLAGHKTGGKAGAPLDLSGFEHRIAGIETRISELLSVAEPEPKPRPGVYKVDDYVLLKNIPYKVVNIFDSGYYGLLNLLDSSRLRAKEELLSPYKGALPESNLPKIEPAIAHPELHKMLKSGWVDAEIAQHMRLEFVRILTNLTDNYFSTAHYHFLKVSDSLWYAWYDGEFIDYEELPVVLLLRGAVARVSVKMFMGAKYYCSWFGGKMTVVGNGAFIIEPEVQRIQCAELRFPNSKLHRVMINNGEMTFNGDLMDLSPLFAYSNGIKLLSSEIMEFRVDFAQAAGVDLVPFTKELICPVAQGDEVRGYTTLKSYLGSIGKEGIKAATITFGA